MELVELIGEIKYETAAAYLLDDGDQEVWIPKSQVHDENLHTENGIEYLYYSIPEWLALKKGLI